MNGAQIVAVVVGAAFACGASAMACSGRVISDAPPLGTPSSDASDAQVDEPAVDAPADAPGVDDSPCQRCMRSPEHPAPDSGTPPGCSDSLAACLADPKCADTYACIVAQSCLSKGTRQRTLICALPCADDAGIVSPNERAAQDLNSMLVCAATNCTVACTTMDAGGQ